MKGKFIHCSSVEEIVSDDELDKVWQYANFGSTPKRDVLKEALLRCACGYYEGYTATTIVHELGLVTQK